ncbi:hypothetical protein COO08_05230 [Bacillus toyonensis]|uniref:hypothetical protein n=1 Tax=Bacillus toyonensis TaxID=155322 RepID=UPI000BEE0829|nr:hypothetical protein [Bacillus toyonensis]PEB19714.1 hypothetical protein COO08_05230 [Bacillus toyonensis]
MSFISGTIGTIKIDKNGITLCEDGKEIILASNNKDGVTYHFENFDQAVSELNKTNERKG